MDTNKDIFETHMKTSFANLAKDRVANVRIVLAKVIAAHIKADGKFYFDFEINKALYLLKKDKDRDVQDHVQDVTLVIDQDKLEKALSEEAELAKAEEIKRESEGTKSLGSQSGDQSEDQSEDEKDVSQDSKDNADMSLDTPDDDSEKPKSSFHILKKADDEEDELAVVLNPGEIKAKSEQDVESEEVLDRSDAQLLITDELLQQDATGGDGSSGLFGAADLMPEDEEKDDEGPEKVEESEQIEEPEKVEVEKTDESKDEGEAEGEKESETEPEAEAEQIEDKPSEDTQVDEEVKVETQAETQDETPEESVVEPADEPSNSSSEPVEKVENDDNTPESTEPEEQKSENTNESPPTEEANKDVPEVDNPEPESADPPSTEPSETVDSSQDKTEAESSPSIDA